MERYFGPQGLLSLHIEGFEFRASQLKMAESVSQCLASETQLLIEAGTGTGKTLAYLIPAVLSGKRVVVSTGTKTLQDQIVDQDIPFIKKHIFPQLRAVCLKGRKNYLCRRRFRDFSYQPTFWNREEAKLYRRFQNWASKTRTGERADIHWLPDQFHTWNEVSCSSEQCLGQQCEDHGRCFLTQIRQDASRAHLLVVNHHLFFADLALRRKGLGEILPDYDAVVFDEAHQLDDVAGIYFGLEFSNIKALEWARDIRKECSKKTAAKMKNLPEILRIVEQMDALSRQLHHGLTRLNGTQGRFSLDIQKLGEGFMEPCSQFIHAFEQMSALLSPSRDADPVMEALCRRSQELGETVREIVEQRDPSMVYWYESTPQVVRLRATPIDIAPIFRERLFEQTGAVVFTSATLSVAGSFDFFKQCIGAHPETTEVLLTSPFDYQQQALLYIPSRFPAPQEPHFCSSAAQEALKILSRTRGRALFLFTSYRNLNEVHRKLEGRLPYPILVQGQKPKRALLTEFREKIDSVLLATSSFWQGIDVPGEALSCLLIDKLPFEVPDDPLIAARMDDLARRGKSPFFHYQVPRATIQLKQGVGRLIRSAQDRGIIVIFDVRLLTKSYGRLFLQSLPPCRVTHHLEEIEHFLLDGGIPSEAESKAT